MTSRLMHRVAARVMRSPLAEPALFYLDGVEYPTSGVLFVTEVAERDDSGVWTRRERRIRIPSADVPDQPVVGDTVEIDGRVWHVVDSLEEGPSFVCILSDRRPD